MPPKPEIISAAMDLARECENFTLEDWKHLVVYWEPYGFYIAMTSQRLSSTEPQQLGDTVKLANLAGVTFDKPLLEMYLRAYLIVTLPKECVERIKDALYSVSGSEK